MLNLPYYLHSLKWVVPASFMLGSAPTYVMVWGCWRGLTLLLPTRIYEAGDDCLYSLYQRMVLFFFECCSGNEIVLSGEVEKLFGKKENVILMMNHQCTVDWMVADMLAVRQNSIGHIRYILKDGLRWIPIYGFYFRQHSCIYVRRSGKFAKEKAVKQLEMITRNKTPFWMVVFPEGTRFNPNKPEVLVKSKKFAENNGKTVLDQLLTPRHKALYLSIQELRRTADAVYDVTVGYANTVDKKTKQRIGAPGLPDFLVGASKQLHIHLNSIPLRDVPEDEEEFKDWLHDRYVAKDKMMKRFYSDDPSVSGTLVPRARVSPLSLTKTLPAFLFFAAVNLPLMITPMGRAIYWQASALTCLLGWFWMAIRS